MKLKAQLTIDINQYENLKPEIEIDTGNLDEAVELIKKLHLKFHKICEPFGDKVNREIETAKMEHQADKEAQRDLDFGLDVQADKDSADKLEKANKALGYDVARTKRR